uniref:pentatricopeptide repeat-containing protein At1g71060, mitochondrial-like n=1 Tax=Erigeron canadensis TaxID=72917 RepID=UPI001CB91DDC|nr:pentatricopeptide repeat-containing protein At1g71060, mitochondrial-like [Erigeron canadensis]
MSKRHRPDSPRPSKSHDRRSIQNTDPDPPKSKPPQVFPSYLDIPNLPDKIKLLCEIIATTPSVQVDTVLSNAGFRVTTKDVEEVLKLSYLYPAAAIKFFRWAGYRLIDRHSPYAWNLVVDILGKNCDFDAMWKAIDSMKNQGLLSLSTFGSVYGSYVVAEKVDEAIRAFEGLGRFGFNQDVFAMNSFLSVICQDGKTKDGYKFLGLFKGKIKPDADTYAILLEGWEKEEDVGNVKRTFYDMVEEIGWEPGNFVAYDSVLSTLLKDKGGGIHEAMKYFGKLKEKNCYPGIRFFKSALNECAANGRLKDAIVLWDAINVQNGFKLDVELYNAMILLYTHVEDVDLARKLLDEMVLNDVYPDFNSYNILFKFLLKSRKLKEAQPLFVEMTKNEFVPTHECCYLAVRVFIDGGDPYNAIKVWKCMIENYNSDLEETGNLLVTGLHDLKRLSEAVKYAEDMIDRGIKLTSTSLAKLRHGLAKAGKGSVYDELFSKWKRY